MSEHPPQPAEPLPSGPLPSGPLTAGSRPAGSRPAGPLTAESRPLRSRPAENGPDGLARCPWALGDPGYLAYHDREWGAPVRGDAAMFERLSLEAFQSGLSWLTILRKREAFRAAFGGFDPAVVAAFGPGDEARLLADAGIVRNRAKIRAVIGNARAALTVPGGLAALMWRHAGGPAVPPVTLAEVPSQTAASVACARELRRCGFTFVGPVTVYAAMQACGLVDDHLAGCFRRGAYSPNL